MARRAVVDSSPGPRGASVAALIAETPLSGAPPSRGVAPLVERAEHAGVVANVLAEIGPELRTRPEELARELLRVAALTMLQGTTDQAPYGWTHCLTLSQAALADAGASTPPAEAVATAATYVTAFWSGLAQQPFDPDARSASWRPRAEGRESNANRAPATVGGSGGPGVAPMVRDLASRAAMANDAHHVKYTLACLRAAEADPEARWLFLDAAAHLADWWSAHPDDDDTLVEQLPSEAEVRGGIASLVG
jgi:hypothetical protein